MCHSSLNLGWPTPPDQRRCVKGNEVTVRHPQPHVEPSAVSRALHSTWSQPGYSSDQRFRPSSGR
eukprot:3226513-Amphidinium_carterae.1